MWLFTQMLWDDRKRQFKIGRGEKSWIECWRKMCKIILLIGKKHWEEVLLSWYWSTMWFTLCSLPIQKTVVRKNVESEDLAINQWVYSLPALFRGKGIWLSYCKYLSLVTQYNNASCRTRRNLEENFIRAFIVLQILALWEKWCLPYPQHILTTLLLFQ